MDGSANASGTYGESFGSPFQRHILAAAFRVPSFLARFRSVLDHTYFTDDTTRVVAKALLAHWDQFRALPTAVTLGQAVSDVAHPDVAKAAAGLVAHMRDADVSDAEAVVARAVEFGRLQAMVNAVLAAADKINKGDRNIRGLIDAAERVGEDVTDLGLDYVNADRVRIYREDYGAGRVATGIVHLDRALGGGPLRGGLYVGLGPPKSGKSRLLVNIGYGPLLSTEENVVFYYTHELQAKLILERFDMRLAGKFWPLRRTDPDKFAAIMQDRVNRFVHGTLVIRSYPTRTAGVSNLRSHITQLKAHGLSPDVIITDYADIMKPERRIGDMRHEQAGIYEDLRGLAGEENAVLWTVSQAKQGALAKETLDMGDFAEAFEKAAVMDAGVALCETMDEKIERRCRLVIIGGRNEEDGVTIECAVDKRRHLIRSTGLFDVSGMRITVPEDPDDAAPTATPPTAPDRNPTKGPQKAPGVGQGPVKKVTLSKHVPPKPAVDAVSTPANPKAPVKVPA